MYKKHSFEEKLKCMKLLDQGYSMRRLAIESGIQRTQFLTLRKRYLAFGEDGLKRKKRHYTTESEKASVLLDVMNKSLSLNDIYVKHNITGGAIHNWRKDDEKQKFIMAKKKAEPTELETLIARNNYLEAENALLKKVRALVEARDAHLKRTGQKPSTN